MKRPVVKLYTDKKQTRIEYMNACIIVDRVVGGPDYHGGNTVHGNACDGTPVFGVSGVAVMDMRDHPSIGWDEPWNE